VDGFLLPNIRFRLFRQAAGLQGGDFQQFGEHLLILPFGYSFKRIKHLARVFSSLP
jgi:hypothetical protein